MASFPPPCCVDGDETDGMMLGLAWGKSEFVIRAGHLAKLERMHLASYVGLAGNGREYWGLR